VGEERSREKKQLSREEAPRNTTEHTKFYEKPKKGGVELLTRQKRKQMREKKIDKRGSRKNVDLT